MPEAAGLIKVIMLVGIFNGEGLAAPPVKQEVTRHECEIAQEIAAVLSERNLLFYSDEYRKTVRVLCYPHPLDREA